jgi:hypothetical protein
MRHVSIEPIQSVSPSNARLCGRGAGERRRLTSVIVFIVSMPRILETMRAVPAEEALDFAPHVAFLQT